MSMSSLNPMMPPLRTPSGQVWDRLTNLHRRLGRLEAFFSGGQSQGVPAVTSLPTAGRAGRILFRTGDNSTWMDTGGGWVQIG
jgi:hypothetical protein